MHHVLRYDCRHTQSTGQAGSGLVLAQSHGQCLAGHHSAQNTESCAFHNRPPKRAPSLFSRDLGCCSSHVRVWGCNGLACQMPEKEPALSAVVGAAFQMRVLTHPVPSDDRHRAGLRHPLAPSPREGPKFFQTRSGLVWRIVFVARLNRIWRQIFSRYRHTVQFQIG